MSELLEKNLTYGFGYINMYTKYWYMKTFVVLAFGFMHICYPNRDIVVAALLNCLNVCPCVCQSPFFIWDTILNIQESSKINDGGRYNLMRRCALNKNLKSTLSSNFIVKTLSSFIHFEILYHSKSTKNIKKFGR